jgi:Lysine-specific metallo-endopeptidase
MTSPITSSKLKLGALPAATHPFAGMVAEPTGMGKLATNTLRSNPKVDTTAAATIAPGAVAARDMSKVSSRSLTLQEKKLARTALENAKTLLDRTESSLKENWNRRVPGSQLSNREVFRQYFGGNSESMRAEVLLRVQRVRDKVQAMLSQDIGKSVVRATGLHSTDYAFVQPASGNERVHLGDRFFSKASTSPLKFDSQAGVFVHELFHLVQVNGRKGVDTVPGYAHNDKLIYSEPVVKQLANTSPALAVANNNLFEWYVEREK